MTAPTATMRHTPLTRSALALMLAAGLLVACQPQSELEQKRAQLKENEAALAEAKANLANLEQTHEDLKAELAKLDTSVKPAVNPIDVTAYTLRPDTFSHYVQVNGEVTSKQNVQISPEMSGRIVQLPVKEGDYVKAGQTLAKLDDETLRLQIKELETSLDLANTLYDKQKRLWDRNIGSEVQYLEAKNRKESLERSLATLRSQLDKTTVRAPFSGHIDQVMVKMGEVAAPGFPIMRLVGNGRMYIEAQVSERYLGRFKVGDEVWVTFPALGVESPSRITALGRVIEPDNRSFTAEVALPAGVPQAAPNLLANVRFSDYTNPEALTLPTPIIQSDGEGDYVYRIDSSDGRPVSEKVYIERGRTNNARTEVLSGLSAGDVVVYHGFRKVRPGGFVDVTAVDSIPDEALSLQ